MFFNQASSWCSSCEKREERRGKEELCSGTVGRWHLFTWPSFLSFWSLLQPFEGSLIKVCKMTFGYFHARPLFVFLDCFWKFVILEKTGGSVERQMARLSEKLLYSVFGAREKKVFFELGNNKREYQLRRTADLLKSVKILPKLRIQTPILTSIFAQCA